MHKSSYDKMEKFVDEYLDKRRSLSILDVGSLNVNGSYRPLFDEKRWTYTGCDIIPGKDVDILLEKAYNWSESFEDGQFDVIISGQAFEHIDYFWHTMEEIYRVLKPGGLVCIIAPSIGGHHYTDDKWRFLAGGFKALAKYVNLKVLHCLTDNEGAWRDTILIGMKENIDEG